MVGHTQNSSQKNESHQLATVDVPRTYLLCCTVLYCTERASKMKKKSNPKSQISCSASKVLPLLASPLLGVLLATSCETDTTTAVINILRSSTR